MVKYRKYDIATKVSLVERYLEELKTDPKHKIADFSYENGIADSTLMIGSLNIKETETGSSMANRIMILLT